MASFFNKGFGRKRESVSSERIPPGQYETRDFPVLTAGPTPRIPLTTWSFTLDGLVETPMHWNWEQFNALPQQSFTNDIHCVTKWSKLDTHWTGVSIETLLEHVDLKPEARYVMAYSHGDYTTNIPLDDLRHGKAFVGLNFEGKPLAPEHGGPSRLVAPHLYFWKSAKWIKGLQFIATDKAGFWEQGGYSMYGDPLERATVSHGRLTDRMEKFQWQIAEVKAITQETPRVKTFTLHLPRWISHLAGQHYDLRLTAEDGYQAERSYSIASPPEQTGEIDLTVELIDDGEVSSYLHDGISVGDPLEVRGPIGGYFVWKDNMAGTPLLLIAGGSGVVPLMAMLRHRVKIGATNPTTLLFSVRTAEETIYHQELMQLAEQDTRFTLVLTYTRQPPSGWTGYQRRIDRNMLTDVLNPFKSQPVCFVCGPTPLVEQVANTLVDLSLPTTTIRTERFGPTGT